MTSTLRLLADPLPVGEATEIPGAVVRVLPHRHGWLPWDIATMTMDLDPLQPSLPAGASADAADLAQRDQRLEG